MKTMSDPSDEIMTELTVRDVHPVPRWHFLLKRSVFWSLAVASVLVGSVAFSIAFYIFFDSEGIPTSTLLNSPFEVVLEGAPLLWLLIFGLFVASAYLSIRHTKHGYRYGTARIVGLLLSITIAMGLILSSIDFGSAVHYYLFSDMSFYEALQRALSDPQ